MRLRRRLREALVGVVEDAVRPLVDARAEALRADLRAWERRSRRDIWTALDQEAARSTGRFVQSSMGPVRLRVDPLDTLRDAVRAAPADGMALEFGVATGATLRVLAEERPGGVFGFDSFAGLPEPWRPGYDAGEFAQEPPEVAGAELVVGLFADTLPGFLADHPGPVAFLHVDCDLYSSTATVLEHVGARFVEGTVVLFDEYVNYPGWQEHEHRAWCEHVERTGLGFEYAGLTMDDEQVWVRVTRV